jgi:hypothetical protein
MSLSLKRPLVIVQSYGPSKGHVPSGLLETPMTSVIPRKERSKEAPRDKQPTFLNPENAFVSMMVSDAL